MLNWALALPTDSDKQGRVDVTSLLVGLIAAGVVIVIAGLLIWYFCQTKWKNNLTRLKWVTRSLLLTLTGSVTLLPGKIILRSDTNIQYIYIYGDLKLPCVCHSSTRARSRRSNASLIMRRLEEVSLQPLRPRATLPPSADDPLGLPSYEEAIARSGQHDAPPPPYPGYVHMYTRGWRQHIFCDRELTSFFFFSISDRKPELLDDRMSRIFTSSNWL